MTIRKILAPVRGDGNGSFVINQAITLAKRFNAHVDVVYIKSASEIPPPYVTGVPENIRESIISAVSKRETEEQASVKALYDQICCDENLSQHATVFAEKNQASVSWTALVGRQSELVAELGRLADLIVVAKPDPVRRLGINTLEESLFNTGKPVLVVPRIKCVASAKHVAIAWNASAVASRAVTLALPLIISADHVTILTGGTSRTHREQAESFAKYLRYHGLNAQIILFETNGKDIGVRLLAEAKGCGADMIVSGAYGHNRHKEILFGGVTEHIIWNMDMPILMSR